jgi:hypothetical protein
MDRNLFGAYVHFVHNPMVTYPNAIESFSARELNRLSRKWIGFKFLNAINDTTNEILRQLSQVFLTRRL